MSLSEFSHRLLRFLCSTELLLGVLWTGLAVLTVAMLVLMRTRWGQSQLLRKCLVLSLLAHVLLAAYATTVRIVFDAPASQAEVTSHVVITDSDGHESAAASPERVSRKPWEMPPDETTALPAPTTPDRAAPQPLPEPRRPEPVVRPEIPSQPDLTHVAEEREPLTERAEAAAELATSPRRVEPPEPLEAPKAARQSPPSLAPLEPARLRPAETPESRPPERGPNDGLPASLLDQPASLPEVAQPTLISPAADALASQDDSLRPAPHGTTAKSPAGAAEEAAAGSEAPDAGRLTAPSLAAITGKTGDAAEGTTAATTPVSLGPPPLSRRQNDDSAPRAVPPVYQLRTAPDRERLAGHRGGSEETEKAVRAALKWLADNQEPDGRWNASRHGAGQENRVAGRDRGGAGARADTGMTGLALLAFLAAGHTDQRGPHQATVQNGLGYLLSVQKPSGSLAGEATTYAAMYCHAMATIALSEAYAMTGDSRLAAGLRRAVDYTVSAQDRTGGGWRYIPNDQGDTSQFGWQLMALKSAELAGVSSPDQTWRGMIIYLRSVSSGQYGGLAAYRVGQPASRPMTAEALVCRQFLGMPAGSPTGIEAGDYLLGELPGDGERNFYYWYYATLGMYQLQGEHWRRWNEALQQTLLPLQVRSGSLAGSWDPNTVWGGYGGRVYTTAIATLCLEVYYRYLPLYAETASVPPLRK